MSTETLPELPQRLEGTLDGIPVVILKDDPCYTPELWYRERKVWALWGALERGHVLWIFWGPDKAQVRQVADRFGAEDCGGLWVILPDARLPVDLQR